VRLYQVYGAGRGALDDEALEELCRREYPRLVGALSLYCGDAAVAEELAQDALQKACQSWGRLASMEAPGAWLHRVAMNLANSHYRRRRAERRALQRSGGLVVAQDDPDVSDAVAVRATVASLPQRQREVVVLRFFLDWSVPETARALGVSPGAVKQLTHRAMTTLRATFPVALEDDGVADRA
jgi:RNA polymerase sigma-70 factor (sigma-E family)